MSFPISPSNGQITVVNGITYTYDSSEGSWTRTPFPLGNVTVTGNVTANKFYTAEGLYWSGNGVAFSSGGGGGGGEDAVLRANVGAYQLYANANIGTLFNGNTTINANLGAYQTYANANAAAQATSIDTINANIGAFYSYANANIGTLFNSNATINANLGAFQTYANANAATQATSIDTINANIGLFYSYANANIGTLYLGNISTQANLGAFQTQTDANLGVLYLGNISTQANLGAYQTYANANAATQATSVDTINANIGAFYAYANTKIGTNNNSNLVIQSTQESVSATTGALVVAGGAGISGNLYVAGNIIASNLVSIGTTTLTVQDPLLYLNADNPSPYNYDIGFFSHFVGGSPTPHYQHTGMARDYATGIWGFFSNIRTEPGATVDWSNVEIIYDTVRVGDLIVSNTTNSTSTTTGALRIAGGAGIAGALYIADAGDVSANIGTLSLGNISTQANLGVLYLGNVSTQANLGAYQTYANANAATQATSIDTINANLGILYLGNVSTQANLGAFQTYANANAVTQATSIDTINANLGVLYLGNVSTQANLGAFQTYANANAVTQATSINSINANIGAFYTYANSKIGTNTNGNLVVAATTTSTSATTGALVVGGGIGVAGNIISGGNITGSYGTFVSNLSIGSGTIQQDALDLNNNNIYNVNTIRIYDPGTSEGIVWEGGSGWSIYESPNDLSNSTGNLQIVLSSTRVFTVDTNQTVTVASNRASTSTTTGALIVSGGIGVAGNVVADKLYTTSGLYWAGNGAAFSSGGGGTPAGSNQQIQYNNSGVFGASSGLVYDGVSLKVNGNLESVYHSGDEGGEIFLQKPDTNTTLAAGITIDIFQNKLRFFENGGTYRGFYLDITSGGTTVGTNIMSGGGGGGSPAGSTGDVQFNNGGAFGATSLFYDSATGNLVLTDTTTSTSTTTGALVVKGGVGVAGNVIADKFYTTNGVFWPNATPYSITPVGTVSMFQGGTPIVYTGTARWYAPYDLSIIKITPRLATASDGNIFMDVRRNSSVTIANLSIYPAQTTGNVFETPTTINSGQYLTVNVTAVGTTGSDLYVQINYIPL